MGYHSPCSFLNVILCKIVPVCDKILVSEHLLFYAVVSNGCSELQTGCLFSLVSAIDSFSKDFFFLCKLKFATVRSIFANPLAFFAVLQGHNARCIFSGWPEPRVRGLLMRLPQDQPADMGNAHAQHALNQI